MENALITSLIFCQIFFADCEYYFVSCCYGFSSWDRRRLVQEQSTFLYVLTQSVISCRLSNLWFSTDRKGQISISENWLVKNYQCRISSGWKWHFHPAETWMELVLIIPCEAKRCSTVAGISDSTQWHQMCRFEAKPFRRLVINCASFGMLNHLNIMSYNHNHRHAAGLLELVSNNLKMLFTALL